MLLVAAALIQLIQLTSGASSWDEVSQLENLNPDSFKDFLDPLLQVAANTYRYPNIKPIPGWTAASRVKPLAPKHGGAHALVYSEGNGDRLILGFRGTDLKSLADKCADIYLFGSIPDFFGIPNASECAQFSNDTLDYYTQALKYTKQVAAAYPESQILLTGHSLGACLANLVSAFFSTAADSNIPVVAFSTPPMKDVFDRKGVAVKHHLVYAVGDEWDELMVPLTQQVGIVCLYEREQPMECSSCRSFGETEMCSRCFLHTHYLAHVIRLVENSQTKPVCTPSREYTIA